MQTNVMEYLEATVQRVPDKVAFVDDTDQLTFRQVQDRSHAIGSFLISEGYRNEPIVVFMPKCANTLVAFFGTIYSGNFYVPLDSEMPLIRIEMILKMLNPRAIICNDATIEFVEKEIQFPGKIYHYNDLSVSQPDYIALNAVRAHQIDTDPIYIVFTSGSTGVPKGVTACHRSVIDYIESLCEVLRPDEETIFGSQTPFFFDACLKEVCPTLKYGAKMVIVPKKLFMFPVKLIEFLNEHQINTICWVASALSMISALKTFDKIVPKYLHTIAFASEVFPIKQFHAWQAALPPDVRFINLYGPTEITGICCFYEVDRPFAESEVLPVGRPFRNTGILLLDENDREAAPGAQGEICVRGTCLTLGYYKNPEMTAKSFVQNPLNDRYPERIYRTGDIGRYNDRGELVFLSRKDFQIKHMGHRIELGEIEVAANMQSGVVASCCLFDQNKKKIILCYAGEVTVAELTAGLKTKLSRYMVPNAVKQLDEMPYTPNGKIDRNLLRSQFCSADSAGEPICNEKGDFNDGNPA